MSDIDRAIVEVDAALTYIDRAGARCDEMDYGYPRELCALWLDETRRARSALTARNVYTALPLLRRSRTTGDQMLDEAKTHSDPVLAAAVAAGDVHLSAAIGRLTARTT